MKQSTCNHKTQCTSIEDSFEQGFSSGFMWKDAWDHKPGGPFIFRGCDLSRAAHNIWHVGWNLGNKLKQLGIFSPNYICHTDVVTSYNDVVLLPERSNQINSIHSEIQITEKKLAKLKQKLSDIIGEIK